MSVFIIIGQLLKKQKLCQTKAKGKLCALQKKLQDKSSSSSYVGALKFSVSGNVSSSYELKDLNFAMETRSIKSNTMVVFKSSLDLSCERAIAAKGQQFWVSKIWLTTNNYIYLSPWKYSNIDGNGIQSKYRLKWYTMEFTRGIGVEMTKNKF
jgi:hypothetical protein